MPIYHRQWSHRQMTTATAQNHPNLAFIKYRANRDNTLRIPMNGSTSMNLDGLHTRTTVSFQPSLPFDELIINGYEIAGAGRDRVSYILHVIRNMANIHERAEVMPENNFPSGAGIASSTSAFAELALAGSKAAGLSFNESELSCLTRRGSGSAARSIPGKFVEWQATTTLIRNVWIRSKGSSRPRNVWSNYQRRALRPSSGGAAHQPVRVWNGLKSEYVS